MSRGINEEEAKKVIVETKLAPTIHKLPDEKLREDVWGHIEARM